MVIITLGHAIGKNLCLGWTMGSSLARIDTAQDLTLKVLRTGSKFIGMA